MAMEGPLGQEGLITALETLKVPADKAAKWFNGLDKVLTDLQTSVRCAAEMQKLLPVLNDVAIMVRSLYNSARSSASMLSVVRELDAGLQRANYDIINFSKQASGLKPDQAIRDLKGWSKPIAALNGAGALLQRAKTLDPRLQGMIDRGLSSAGGSRVSPNYAAIRRRAAEINSAAADLAKLMKKPPNVVENLGKYEMLGKAELEAIQEFQKFRKTLTSYKSDIDKYLNKMGKKDRSTLAKKLGGALIDAGEKGLNALGKSMLECAVKVGKLVDLAQQIEEMIFGKKMRMHIEYLKPQKAQLQPSAVKRHLVEVCSLLGSKSSLRPAVEKAQEVIEETNEYLSNIGKFA